MKTTNFEKDQGVGRKEEKRVEIENKVFFIRRLSNAQASLLNTESAYNILLRTWEPARITQIPEYKAIGEGDKNSLVCVSFEEEEEFRENNAQGFFDILKGEGVSKVVIVKNHPDADIMPTKKDEDAADRLSSMGNINGIEVIDQLIMSRMEYFSFAENGLPR